MERLLDIKDGAVFSCRTVDDDFPDVGMHFKQKFSDTEPYKIISEKLKEK